MTGAELIAWIQENEAEDMEMLLLTDDGTIETAKPEVQSNRRIKEEYWEARFLPETGESVIL